MSRLSNVVKRRTIRTLEKGNAELRHLIHRARHPKPVAKSEANLTPKRKAAREKRGGTL